MNVAVGIGAYFGASAVCALAHEAGHYLVGKVTGLKPTGIGILSPFPPVFACRFPAEVDLKNARAVPMFVAGPLAGAACAYGAVKIIDWLEKGKAQRNTWLKLLKMACVSRGIKHLLNLVPLRATNTIKTDGASAVDAITSTVHRQSILLPTLTVNQIWYCLEALSIGMCALAS